MNRVARFTLNKLKRSCFSILTSTVNRSLSQLTVNRSLSLSRHVNHGDFEWEEAKNLEDIVNMTYIDRDEIRHDIKAKCGDNVLFLAHRHDIDIEGACEAALVSYSHAHFKPIYWLCSWS